MHKYSLMTKGQTEWQFITAHEDEDPKSVFDRALKAHGAVASDAYSFMRVGKSRSTTSYPSALSVTMWDRTPGEQLIFQVKDLPRLSHPAFAMIGKMFDHASISKIIVDDQPISKEALACIDELSKAGLIEEIGNTGESDAIWHRLTQTGKDYPRPTAKFAREHAPRMKEKVTELNQEEDLSMSPDM